MISANPAPGIMNTWKTVADINWATWTPTERAVLLFVVQDGRILLIRKKLGLGAGKINGPGGRIEPGETPEAAAIRETQEELCITPHAIRHCGELSFQFQDGFSIHAHVFKTEGFSGAPQETREAIPHWFALDAIPYHEMWADDAHWLPLMLADRFFQGYFLFDGDAMADHRISSASPGRP